MDQWHSNFNSLILDQKIEDKTTLPLTLWANGKSKLLRWIRSNFIVQTQNQVLHLRDDGRWCDWLFILVFSDFLFLDRVAQVINNIATLECHRTGKSPRFQISHINICLAFAKSRFLNPFCSCFIKIIFTS